MTFDERVEVPPHVLTRELQDEMVLLNLQSESYFGLDSVGTRIWKRVSEAESLQEAYDCLLDEYDVDPNRLRQDMLNLIEELLIRGLLVLHQS